ncbi:MAG: hypothetical protein ACOX2F_01420 [bacterium]
MNGIRQIMSEKTKTVLLYSFLFIVIATRVYLETAHFSKRVFFSYAVLLHHSSWYLFVVFYFFTCARYILGMKKESIKYLTLLSPVVMIPVMHACFTGKKLQLSYLKGSFQEVAFNVFTLFKFHGRNSEFFIEMIVLLVFFIAGSWFISKSVVRTLLNTLFGFFGAAMFAGLHLFGVYPKTKAYFKIHTVFPNHQLLALIYFGLATAVFILFSFPEIKKILLKEPFKYIFAAVLGVLISLPLTYYGVQFFYKTVPMKADLFLLGTTFAILVTALYATIKKNSGSFYAGRFFPIVFLTISTMIIVGLIPILR